MISKDKAAQLFAKGLSTNEIGRRLGISAYKAKQLKPQIDQAKPEPAAPGTAEDRVWPIELEVPFGDLDKMIETLGPEDLHDAVMQMEDPDKAQILTFALQNRLRKLIETPAQPEPKPETP
jgi:hypothetical protein